MIKQTLMITQALYTRVQQNDPTLTTLDLLADARAVEAAKSERVHRMIGNHSFYNIPLQMNDDMFEHGLSATKSLSSDELSQAFENALSGNYFITDVLSASAEQCDRVNVLCADRNRRLAELINAIKKPDSFKQSQDKRLVKLAGAVEALEVLKGADLITGLIRVKTSIERLVIKAGAHINDLPNHFYLKEYHRYIEGYLFALDVDNDKSQWKALHRLAEPFTDTTLQACADMILPGLLAIDLFENLMGDDFIRAKDLLSIAIGVVAATPQDSKWIELKAYARLTANDPERLSKLDEMRASHTACMETLKGLLSDEAAKEGVQPTTLRAIFGNTVSEIALKTLRAFYRKPTPQACVLFQPFEEQVAQMGCDLPTNKH